MQDLTHIKSVARGLEDRQFVCIVQHDDNAFYAIWDTNYSVYGLGGQFVVPFGTIDAFAIKAVAPCIDDYTGEPWFARGGVIGPGAKTMQEAIERWNHHPTEAALVEALKEAGDVIESYHKTTGIDLGEASRMPFYSDTIKKIDAALKQAGVK